MLRPTKIVATLGPASHNAQVLARMIDAGLDVVRLNFSYGTAAEHRQRVNMIRTLARRAGRSIGVLMDLRPEDPNRPVQGRQDYAPCARQVHAGRRLPVG